METFNQQLCESLQTNLDEIDCSSIPESEREDYLKNFLEEQGSFLLDTCARLLESPLEMCRLENASSSFYLSVPMIIAMIFAFILVRT